MPEENFSLEHYLNERNLLPTQKLPSPTIDKQASSPKEETANDEDNIRINKTEQNLFIIDKEKNEETTPKIHSHSHPLEFIEQISVATYPPLPTTQPESNQLSMPSSSISSMIHLELTIRVEVNEKQSSMTSNLPTSRNERPSTRESKQSTSTNKTITSKSREKER